MLFSSITFLYYFLPITLLVYFVVPQRYKNVVLLIASFFFYFWGEPKYCILMAAEILCGYIGGLQIAAFRRKEKGTKAITVFWIGIILALLGFFKYADFAIGTVNSLLGSEISLLRVALPIGISFYSFQIISYLADVCKGDVPAEWNLLDFATYVSMFPQLIAGPIVRFSTVQKELKSRVINMEKISAGIYRFVTGLVKKVLIADVLGAFILETEGIADENTFFLWIVAIAYALQIYYDFSGYSDMAIGLGSMLGFYFPENFDHPYSAKSITEFWRRWHMTLGGWFRDYVYIPLGGNRCSRLKFLRNVVVVWFLSGLWHGADWNFVCWGLYFGVILIAEKIFLLKLLGKIPGVLQRIYTIALVVISFVIFRFDDLSVAAVRLKGMLVPNFSAITELTGYQMRNYGFVLLLAMVGAFPIRKKITEVLERKDAWIGCKVIFMPLLMVAAFVVVTAFLIQSSVHPFLYFRF